MWNNRKRQFANLLTLTAWVWLASLSPTANAQSDVFLEPAFPNLEFRRPVDLQNSSDGTDRIFVVEQAGRVHVFENDPSVESTTVFLDIQDRVNDSGGEEGLLGLAFHPDYSQNGYLYVYYTASGNRCLTVAADDCSKVSRFSVNPDDPDRAETGTEATIIEIGQPFSNHNGGQIRFGPDGYLYIAFGDGGSGGDPFGNGQNGASLLGSILRIDVNTENEVPYTIPPDNPFLGTDFRDEIFAYGLRNPWRFSFDFETGDLWVGDVGQNSFEEIDIVVSGGNYGWNTMEGSSCFSPQSGCNQSGLELPVWSYARTSGRSVTGGFVYRGADIPDLIGTYVYGDFASGRMWGLAPTTAGYANQLLQSTGLSIASFGIDEGSELYVCASDGSIYRVTSSSPSSFDDEIPSRVDLGLYSYPHPVSSQSTVVFDLPEPSHASIEVFDAVGSHVKTITNRPFDAGTQRLSFSVGDLIPGTYFYRIATDKTLATGKIVVI